MTAQSGGEALAALDTVTFAEVRAELRRLLTLADTAVKPRPDRELPAGHPFGPGVEWRVKYRMTDAHDWTAARHWSAIVQEPADVASVVFIHTPDSMTGDYLATPTTEARELAMAILAACERADQQAAGIPQLADRRRKKNPREGIE